jgi:hypothetical protein
MIDIAPEVGPRSRRLEREEEQHETEESEEQRHGGHAAVDAQGVDAFPESFTRPASRSLDDGFRSLHA